MKRALSLALLLATTASLLSACIVVPPRDHYHGGYRDGYRDGYGYRGGYYGR